MQTSPSMYIRIDNNGNRILHPSKMSATGSQAASRKRKEPAEMVKAEDADAAQVLEPQHAMPEMQRPGYAHPQVEYSRYFPMPQGFRE